MSALLGRVPSHVRSLCRAQLRWIDENKEDGLGTRTGREGEIFSIIDGSQGFVQACPSCHLPRAGGLRLPLRNLVHHRGRCLTRRKVLWRFRAGFRRRRSPHVQLRREEASTRGGRISRRSTPIGRTRRPFASESATPAAKERRAVTVHGPGSGPFFGRQTRPRRYALAENMDLTPWNIREKLLPGCERLRIGRSPRVIGWEASAVRRCTTITYRFCGSAAGR